MRRLRVGRGRFAQLQPDDQADRGAGQAEAGDHRRAAMTAQEQAQAITGLAPARGHRLELQPRTQVRLHLLDRRGARGGIGGDAGGGDLVQVAGQRLRQRRGAAQPARLRRLCRAVQGESARRRRRRRSRVDRNAVQRPRAAQQLVQQDAERIQVGAHAVSARRHLRRGVAQRHRHAPTLRAAAARGQRGQAEVQQHRSAGAVDQHVGRLDVRMQRTLGVRIGQAVAQADEQFHARADVESAPVAPAVDRLALYQLHGEPRIAVRVDTAVEQRGDVGMLEHRQHAALVAHRFGQQRRRHLGADALQRDDLRVLAVGAAGAVDLAHAAGADDALDAPGAERGADPRIGAGAGAARGCLVAGQDLLRRLQQGAAQGIGGEQAEERRVHRRIGGVQHRQRLRALVLAQIGVRVEHLQGARLR